MARSSGSRKHADRKGRAEKVKDSDGGGGDARKRDPRKRAKEEASARSGSSSRRRHKRSSRSEDGEVGPRKREARETALDEADDDREEGELASER